jgi:hypothetical protein
VLNSANSFTVPFHYDDRYGVLNNDNLHNLWNIWAVLLDHRAGEIRPLVSLSFALNYYWGGVNTVGYHIVNLLLHLGNAILVYFFLGRVHDLASGRAPSLSPSAPPLPAAVAAVLFVSHPVQTETVTYIWGRSDLLCTFFSLLTLLCFARANDPRVPEAEGKHEKKIQPKTSRKRSLYVFAAVASFALALGSKAAALSFLFVLWTFDYYFISRGDVKKWWRNLLSLHVALLAIAAVRVGLYYLPQSVQRFLFPPPPGAIEFFIETQAWDERPDFLVNLFTQCRALLQYLKLLFFPVGLTVDHDLPFSRSLFEPAVLTSLGVLVLLIAAVFFLYDRMKSVSFAICWILLTLSFFFIFPLPDPVVERRLYLPSIGFCWCVAAGLQSGAKKFSELWSRERLRVIGQIAPAAVLVAFYVITALERNTVWHDPYTLWQDAVRKAPNKERPQTNLAVVSVQQGRFPEAIWGAKMALVLNPASEKARYCLLDAYVNLQGWEFARQIFMETLRTYPYYAVRWYIWQHQALQQNRGLFLQAISQFEQELARTAGNADGHIALGFLYARVLGDGQRALWHFEESLKFTPERFKGKDVHKIIKDLKGQLSQQQRGGGQTVGPNSP